MVISELLANAERDLKDTGNAAFEAAQLVGFVLNIPPGELILNGGKEAGKEAEARLSELIKRRLSNEPLQYILGSWEFMSLPFFVSKDALIPRQDTETLVEFILSKTDNSEKTLLDIGTGTGCIPISIAHFKKNFTCFNIS